MSVVNLGLAAEGICPVCQAPLVICSDDDGCERGRCTAQMKSIHGSHLIGDHYVSHFWVLGSVAYGCCSCGPVDGGATEIQQEVGSGIRAIEREESK